MRVVTNNDAFSNQKNIKSTTHLLSYTFEFKHITRSYAYRRLLFLLDFFSCFVVLRFFDFFFEDFFSFLDSFRLFFLLLLLWCLDEFDEDEEEEEDESLSELSLLLSSLSDDDEVSSCGGWRRFDSLDGAPSNVRPSDVNTLPS